MRFPASPLLLGALLLVAAAAVASQAVPANLPASAPVAGFPNLRYFGCWSDIISDTRVLPFSTHRDYYGADPIGNCSAAAASQGSLFFGLQFGTQCFFGSEFRRFDQPNNGASSGCDVACPGNPALNCGGSYANQVYMRVVAAPSSSASSSSTGSAGVQPPSVFPSSTAAAGAVPPSAASSTGAAGAQPPSPSTPVCSAGFVPAWNAAPGAAGSFRSLNPSQSATGELSLHFVGSDAAQLVLSATTAHVLCPFLLGADGGTYTQGACTTEQALSVSRILALSSSADGLLLAAGAIDTPWSYYRNAGAVVVLGRSSRSSSDWTLLQTFTPSKAVFRGGIDYMWFGASVRMSADGNTIAVGAFGDNNDNGADFVYRRAAGASQWNFDVRVRGGAPAGAAVSFGNVMSADASTIVQPVGQTLYVLALGGAGQAAVETQRVVLPAPVTGVLLSQDASTLVAPSILDASTGKAQVNVFTRATPAAPYTLQAVLLPSTPNATFVGTFSIDADANRVAVLLQDKAALQLQPRLYLRVGTEWKLQADTLAAVPAPNQLAPSNVGVAPPLALSMSRDGKRIAITLPAEAPQFSTYEAALAQSCVPDPAAPKACSLSGVLSSLPANTAAGSCPSVLPLNATCSLSCVSPYQVVTGPGFWCSAGGLVGGQACADPVCAADGPGSEVSVPILGGQYTGPASVALGSVFSISAAMPYPGLADRGEVGSLAFDGGVGSVPCSTNTAVVGAASRGGCFFAAPPAGAAFNLTATFVYQRDWCTRFVGTVSSSVALVDLARVAAVADAARADGLAEVSRAVAAETQLAAATAAVSVALANETARASGAEGGLRADAARLSARVAVLEAAEPSFLFRGLQSGITVAYPLFAQPGTGAASQLNKRIVFDAPLSARGSAIQYNATTGVVSIVQAGAYRLDAFVHLYAAQVLGGGAVGTGVVAWMTVEAAPRPIGPNILNANAAGVPQGTVGDATFVSTLVNVPDSVSAAAPFTAQCVLVSMNQRSNQITDASVISVTKLK